MNKHPQYYDVLAVGISAVDDILTVEQYPPHGVKIPILASSRHGGGLACTAVAAAATLGGKTAFVGRFGDDELSRFMRRILAERGVDLTHTIDDPAGGPYHSHIVVDRPTGERTIFYDQSRFRPVQAADISSELLASTGLLLVDYIGEPGPLELMRKARIAGVPVLIDMEGRPPRVAALLAEVDHLVVPEEFARWFAADSDLSVCCAALARTPRASTVVTAGKLGCWWTDSPERPPVHQPAFAVEAVNTNGCGDVFHGAYALAIARSLSIVEAVVFAGACAALKAAAAGGGWDALPTARGAAALLSQQLDAGDACRDLVGKVERLDAAVLAAGGEPR